MLGHVRIPEPSAATPTATYPAAARAGLAAVLCGLLLLVVGCDPLVDGGSSAAAPDAGAGRGNSAPMAQLDGLAVRSWASMSGYTRAKFPHWSSQGGGCDTREVVLKRDGQSVRAGDGCKITIGSWLSPYDGRSASDPQDLDIDHLIPLANAWRTGAKEWTDAQREQFANDLTNPQLLAVTVTANRSKGDQDPADWKPPAREYWCVYARNWVAVKSHWKLSVRIEEKAALADMLGTCS